MPLTLSPITEKDTLSWTRIRALAYLGPTHELVHLGPISESSVLSVAEDRKKEINKPNTWHWKIVDTDLSPSPDDPEDNSGRTIAIAVWSLQNPSRSLAIDAAKLAEESPPFLPPELRLDVLNALFTPIRAAQLEIMGNSTYLMLHSLATHPDHHRKGAGTMLLQWGLKKADEMSLETYLDTTVLARPLYEKWGFELVKGIEFDRKPWGGDGVDWHGCMVRKPSPSKKSTT
ncbi:uncharacterized protein BDR25DRAFT_298205 [Lindgomyces ingoldianus]|uniref:Uncharacterized protein n=1 Tax=Lindgomyces ingoldianus TaxID=673940 RepID=A0ACB6Q8T2_9PLEO|nr:uncharacterized protein BDR25DRAFT_298205 [Lindgomyces ingoldianus]KAF2463393.1 hypothetical protein BDR25DRAFT_298205 [Lindgomyces ingoldianus]